MKNRRAFIDKMCWSLWEGCGCGEYRNHTGNHRCGAPNCDCEWTDAQAQEWERGVKGMIRGR